ncbi:MAG: YaaA family protein [Rikenellaceae bacterium]
MIALISPAKTMLSATEIISSGKKIEPTEPRFLNQTNSIISKMLPYSTEELKTIFKISPSIAKELKERFATFFDSNQLSVAAVESYDGVVYKHFKLKVGYSLKQSDYLQKNVRISSLLYGLLRPFDAIKPYRMEGFVRLSYSDERVDMFWRDYQTQTLIEDVKCSGGELIYLASKEEQRAFHWKEVRKAVRVIDIQFLQYKGDKLRQVVIYTKMARGEMIKYMVENGIENSEELKKFEWSGYTFNDELSSEDIWVWTF